jgi:flagellar hook-associated protein 2
MSTITNSSTGTTYLSGSVSGINSAALIKAAVDAKLKKADRIDDSVSSNATKISAYQTLQSQVQDVTEALAKLKKGTSTTNSSFDAKQVTAKSSDSTAADNILKATVTSSAPAGTYRVVVQQLAQSMAVTSAVQSSKTAALGMAGSFNLALEGYAGAAINITAGMSLEQIASTINAASAQSGVTASLMQTGSGYKLVLTGAETAKEFSVSGITGTDVLQGLGVTNSSGGFATVSQEAKPAIITLNGTTIESDTNRMDNVLDGLTLDLENAAPSTTITLTIGNNTEGVKETIQEFIDAYNTLRDYIAQNQKVTDGTVSEYAYLFGDNLLRTMSQSLSRLLVQPYGSSDYNSLGSMGITLDENNHLVLDEDALDTALENHFADVKDFFASGSGFADSIHTMLSEYGVASTGDIAERINTLTALNGELTTKSDDIKERTDMYEKMLINKFANMETKINQANVLKKQIEAILKGSTDSD